jgi:hypothetical protein
MMSLAPDDLKFMGETEFVELERNNGEYWNVGIRKLLKRLGVTGGLSAQPIVSYPSPLDFTADLQAHGERFVEGTRQWVFDKIEAWRKDRDGSRCLVLLAGPGTCIKNPPQINYIQIYMQIYNIYKVLRKGLRGRICRKVSESHSCLGGGNPSNIYLWWILWISICRTRRS